MYNGHTHPIWMCGRWVHQLSLSNLHPSHNVMGEPPPKRQALLADDLLCWCCHAAPTDAPLRHCGGLVAQHFLCQSCHTNICQNPPTVCGMCQHAIPTDFASMPTNPYWELAAASVGRSFACPYTHHGCTRMLYWGDEYTAHISTCDHINATCDLPDCKWEGTDEEVLAHRVECEYRPITCHVWMCTWRGERTAFTEHMQHAHGPLFQGPMQQSATGRTGMHAMMLPSTKQMREVGYGVQFAALTTMRHASDGGFNIYVAAPTMLARRYRASVRIGELMIEYNLGLIGRNPEQEDHGVVPVMYGHRMCGQDVKVMVRGGAKILWRTVYPNDASHMSPVAHPTPTAPPPIARLAPRSITFERNV